MRKRGFELANTLLEVAELVAEARKPAAPVTLAWAGLDVRLHVASLRLLS
jgi:hypothetical protein